VSLDRRGLLGDRVDSVSDLLDVVVIDIRGRRFPPHHREFLACYGAVLGVEDHLRYGIELLNHDLLGHLRLAGVRRWSRRRRRRRRRRRLGRRRGSLRRRRGGLRFLSLSRRGWRGIPCWSRGLRR